MSCDSLGTLHAVQGVLVHCLLWQRAQREAMKNGFLNQMVSEAAAKLRQEVQKMLQGLCDTAVDKISRLQQVCKMGPSGKHWADDYDPSSGKTILQYAESTLLQVLQPPLKKLADEVQQAAD